MSKRKNGKVMIPNQTQRAALRRMQAPPQREIHLESFMGERIRILRERMGLTAKELADQIGISASTQSRIENAEENRIYSDLLLKYADFFHVTLDYLTGRTEIEGIPATIVSLGLTKKAAENILHRRADQEILNRLLESDSFCSLTRYMFAYLSGQSVVGLKARNDTILSFEKSVLQSLGDEDRDQRNMATAEFNSLNAEQLIDPTEFNMSLLMEKYRKVVTGIRRDIESGNPLSQRMKSDDALEIVNAAANSLPDYRGTDPEAAAQNKLQEIFNASLFQKVSKETRTEMEAALAKALKELSGEDP